MRNAHVVQCGRDRTRGSRLSQLLYDRETLSTMAQKRKEPALPKITDFLSATSGNVRESAEGDVSPAPAKRSKH